MKIKLLHFKKHPFYGNLELNFTYPKGHPKEGQPMNKVVFHGEPCVGKSTILYLLSKYDDEIKASSFNESFNHFEIEGEVAKEEVLDFAKGYNSLFILNFYIQQKDFVEIVNDVMQYFDIEFFIDESDNCNLRHINRVWETGAKIRISDNAKEFINKCIVLFNRFVNEINESIMVFDNPETNLSVDIQKRMIRLFDALNPNIQKFYATNSPIILSEFEPCERFHLRFNQENEIYVSNASGINGKAPEGSKYENIIWQNMWADTMGSKGDEMWARIGKLLSKLYFHRKGSHILTESEYFDVYFEALIIEIKYEFDFNLANNFSIEPAYPISDENKKKYCDIIFGKYNHTI